MEESRQLGQRCGGRAGCQLGGGPLWGFIAKPTPGHSPATFRSRFSGIPSWFPQQTPRHPPGPTESRVVGTLPGSSASRVIRMRGSHGARASS